MPLRKIDYQTSFILPGEQGHKRLDMTKAVRKVGDKSMIYCAPYENGRLHPTRGYYVDWETEVTVVE